MTVTSKVRLYDLAKELKLDTKRLIEEVRREGVDVSVPSNSISKELADKIRNKYFPKKEASAPRAVRVVKKAVRPVEATAETAEEADAPAVEAAPEEVMPVEATPAPSASPEAQSQSAARPMTARLVKKLSPAARAEHPDADAGGTAAAAAATQSVPETVADQTDEVAETIQSPQAESSAAVGSICATAG